MMLHTKPPKVIQVVNANCVIALDDNEKLRGEARRHSPGNPWIIKKVDLIKMTFVGRITGKLPEVLQRKLVIAMLKEL